MGIIGITVLHEAGIPIYKKFRRGKERPIEPLIAAILGLANEVGLGDIAHASFEKAGLVVLRGVFEEKLLLSLLVDKVSYQSYVKGVYLTTKIERSIGKLPDYVTDEIVDKTKNIIDRYFYKLDKLPSIFNDAFISATEKFGPMFHGSLILLLYREFGEDPLLTMIRDPKRFINALDELLGIESTNQLFSFFLKYICDFYYDVCQGLKIDDVRFFTYKFLNNMRERSGREAIIVFRDIIVRGLDVLLDKINT